MFRTRQIYLMQIKVIYRALIVLGVAISMASLTVTAAPWAQQVATEAKSPKPTPQALWVVDGSGPLSVSIFGASRLKLKTGIVASNGITTDPADGPVESLAFDSQNDLWFSLCPSQSTPGFIVELSVAGLKSLANSGSAGPKIVIEDPTTTDTPEFLACPRELRFDQSGNLWVEVTGGSTPALLEYTSAELSSSEKQVTPTPTVIDTSAVQSNYAPALAFDKDGNLWQSGGVLSSGNPEDEQQTIVEYTAEQLAAGTPTDPNQTLIVADTTNIGALNAPSSITFDTNGDLWVAFALGGTDNGGGVEEIAASDLTGAGTSTPSPAATLSSAPFVSSKAFGTLASFADPNGLAFDSAGDLWVANESKQAEQGKKLGDGSIVEFTASQLTTGSPVPALGILANKNDANIGAPIYMTFGPPLP
jgi:streptogramin lyase